MLEPVVRPKVADSDICKGIPPSVVGSLIG